MKIVNKLHLLYVLRLIAATQQTFPEVIISQSYQFWYDGHTSLVFFVYFHKKVHFQVKLIKFQYVVLLSRKSGTLELLHAIRIQLHTVFFFFYHNFM